MAVETEHKTFTSPTSTGEQTYTFRDITNQPIALFFHTTQTIAADIDTAENDLIMCIGFGTKNSTAGGSPPGTAAGQYATCSFAEGNVDVTSCNFRVTDEAVITIIDTSGNLIAQATLKSTAAGSPSSFVLNWTTAPGTAFEFHVWAVAGADIVDAVVGHFFADTAEGNRDITNIGLSDGGVPDAVFLLTGASDASSPPPPGTVTTVASQFTIGVMLENQGAAGASYFSVDDVDTSDSASLSTSTFSVLSTKSGSPAVSYKHEYVSMLTDGFRIKTTNASSAGFRVYYMAIRGGKWNRTGHLAPTSTGPQDYDTDDDFTPRGFFAWTELTARSAIGIGTSSNNGGVVEGASAMGDRDGLDISSTGRRMTIDSVALVISRFNLQWEAVTSSYKTSSPRGITLNWTTVQGSGGDAVSLIMVGDGKSAPTPGRRRHGVFSF